MFVVWGCGALGVGGGEGLGAAQVADQGGASGGLDVIAKIAAEPKEEDNLGDHEHRTDEQADDVIDEGGLFALEVVTDELNDPADDEAADAD